MPRDESTYRSLIAGSASRDDRQRDKLIAVAMREIPQLFSQKEVLLRSGERERFMDAVRTGDIKLTDLFRIVHDVVAPLVDIEGEERITAFREVFDKIQESEHCREILMILAHFMIGHVRSSHMVKVGHVEKFVQKYSDASSYLNEVIVLIQQVLLNSDARDAFSRERRYTAAARALGKILYGKQWEYLTQAISLYQEAKRVI